MKNLLISGVVGVIFLIGGFWFGMRRATFPIVPAPKISADKPAAPTDMPPAISVESLRKASQDMVDLNKTLQAREQAVIAREERAAQLEDELSAERAALDRSHAKFSELYGQFQQRLELVEANELDQLQRQDELYAAMGPTEAIDLIRARDDSTMVRLFSVMEVKALAKLVGEWKTKYPDDVPRLARALDEMGRVLPKDKMKVDGAAPADSTPGPGTNSDPSPAPAAPDPSGSTPRSDSSQAPTASAAN